MAHTFLVLHAGQFYGYHAFVAVGVDVWLCHAKLVNAAAQYPEGAVKRVIGFATEGSHHLVVRTGYFDLGIITVRKKAGQLAFPGQLFVFFTKKAEIIGIAVGLAL